MNNFSSQPTTLVELLRQRAQNQPDKRGYTFLKEGETEETSFTYAQLDRYVRTIAAKLQSLLAPGERALLLYPPGLDYIAAFFACLYAGIVAVPTYPPRRNRPDPRFQAIVANAQASMVLTTTEILSSIDSRLTEIAKYQNLRWLATDNFTTEIAEAWQMPDIHGDTLAFLQYTSGSTGTPKGVMVSHKNVLYNEEMFRLGFGNTENTIGVGWLPLFHDMGLIGNVLQPLYVGCPIVLMSPMAFLQKPFRWLQAISCYHASSSAGPNFAYDLCVHKITPEQRAKLDLSCWEVAGNGAEPIRVETLDRFTQTFEPCGFRRRAFYPCYGMAETTLIISGGLKTALPVVYEVDKDSLKQHRVRAVLKGENTHKIVGCGQTWLDQKIVIVEPETFLPCPDQQIGEIWVSGENVALGYWKRPEETRQTFYAHLANTDEGPFLRTGDLGFLKDGELFVTGRLKDLIIIRGRNYYPQDIESTVENSHIALNANSGTAFSIEREGEERLIIVQEVQRTYLRHLDVNGVVEAIRQAVSEQYELPVDTVLLLKTGSIPKTSSGKIQRYACRAKFMANNLEVVGKWQQPMTDENAQFIQNAATNQPVKIRQKLQNADKDDYERILTDFIQNELARVFKITPSQIDVQQPLNTMGIDSIMAVELTNWMQSELDVNIPMDKLMQDISIANLAMYIKHQITETHSPTQTSLTTVITPSVEEQMLLKLDQLSDEEVDALFEKHLSA